MQRIEKAGAQKADAPFTFVLSDESIDRAGDVVVQSGISLATFRKNPVALFSHNSRQPIGTWENIRREGGQLLADLKLAARGTSRMIDELRSLVEQKILRAASIGFGVMKSEPLDPERPYAGQKFLKTELFEASLVAVPANANALMVRSLSPELKSLFFVDGNTGTAPAPSLTRNPATKGKAMTIAEKIKAAQERRAAIDARVAELKALAENSEGLTDEQSAEVDTLVAEAANVDKSIATLNKLEAALAAKAEPVTGSGAPRFPVPSGGHAKAEPAGTLLARVATAHVFAHLERKSVDQVVRERYAHDQRVDAVLKTGVNSANSYTAGWAAELVATDVQGFIDALVPFSAYAALASKGLIVDFGTNGSVSVPYRGGANTDLAGAFVGESGSIPVKRTTIAAALLNRYKMAVISTLTKELARSSTPQAEMLIRQFMADDTSVALDKALLDGVAAVSGVRPASILNGVSSITESTETDPLKAALEDLKTLMDALIASGNGRRPVFMVNTAQRLALATMYDGGNWMFKDEVAAGRILGVELISSMNVNPGSVILVDAANFVTGLGTPEFDASDTATIVMANADTTPATHATNASDDTVVGTAEQVPRGGGLRVTDPRQYASGKAGDSGVAVSMFQQWSIALRTILPVSWTKGRPGSVQWAESVSW